MKRYFCEQHTLGQRGDSAFFEWTSYFEYDGRWVSRHIDVFPEIVIMYHRPECSEAPIEDMGDSGEITAEEFTEAWQHYARIPHGTTRLDNPIVRNGVVFPFPLPPIQLVTEDP